MSSANRANSFPDYWIFRVTTGWLRMRPRSCDGKLYLLNEFVLFIFLNKTQCKTKTMMWFIVTISCLDILCRYNMSANLLRSINRRKSRESEWALQPRVQSLRCSRPVHTIHIYTSAEVHCLFTCYPFTKVKQCHICGLWWFNVEVSYEQSFFFLRLFHLNDFYKPDEVTVCHKKQTFM